MSQLVAYNMAFFRKAADLGQQEFGQLVGWSAASVSAAERSWDGKRIKKFDADEITEIAAALGLPVTALFLLPADHRTAVRYVIDMEGKSEQLSEVFPLEVFPFPAELAVVARPAYAAYKDRVTSLRYGGPPEPPRDPHSQAKADLALAKFAVHEAENRLTQLGHTPERDAKAEPVHIDEDIARTREELDSLLTARDRVKVEIEQAVGRIEYLRFFERRYRTRLQAFVEGQLRDLYDPEMQQQAEQRIKDLQEQAGKTHDARASAVLLRQDGTYEVVPLGPDDDIDRNDNEGLSDHDTEE